MSLTPELFDRNLRCDAYIHLCTMYMHENNFGYVSGIHYLLPYHVVVTCMPITFKLFVIETLNFTHMCIFVPCIYKTQIICTFYNYSLFGYIIYSLIATFLSITPEIFVKQTSIFFMYNFYIFFTITVCEFST